ncbi:AbiV family abortive infection protein [Oceanicaulis sp. HTCC2633]|uniref:AbiV family abortive infection protein n=1 Tax=Oceanicaulis sp. HTCC2633 TaxID=314254 RepID=UPI00138A11AE|nr:AbiV family abortive infection protein [Oceanicaulis sp. HTCC2633]
MDRSPAYRNAEQLIEDAELLFTHKRIRSAYVLSVHAFEELGKAILRAEGEASTKDLEDHKKKLRRALRWIIYSNSFFMSADQVIASVIKNIKFSNKDEVMVEKFLSYFSENLSVDRESDGYRDALSKSH